MNVKTSFKEVIESYPHFDQLSSFINSNSYYPSKKDVFRCFDIDQIKVVILGQDPYHGPNQAIGLAFGVNDHIKNPPSLKNIEKELKQDLNLELSSSTLEQWAKQGVLLLNAALTVKPRTPTSHMDLWLPFTKYIIDYLNKNYEGIVYVAWGAFAYDKLKDVDMVKNELFVSSHPSPFSAYRKFREFPSFLGSKIFSRINEVLDEKIKWGE